MVYLTKDTVTRGKIDNILKEQAALAELLEQLAAKLYKRETGKDLVGGYKKGLRELGFVV